MPVVDGVEHRFVDAGGLRMHVADAGSGPPVVMLHGWPQHWYLWRDVIPLLRSRFRLVCPDLRGFGWTDAPPGGYEKERMSDDVVALLDALGLERVHLVGHDWGGWIAFLLGIRHPERVDRLVVFNIIHPWPRRRAMLRQLPRMGYQVLAASGGAARMLRDRPDIFRRRLRAALADRSAWTDDELDCFVGRVRRPDRLHATTQLYRTFLLREAPAMSLGRYRSARLTVPALLLFGTADTAIDAALLDGWQSHADDMRVEMVPGCGHFIVDERPELVAQRIVEALAPTR